MRFIIIVLASFAVTACAAVLPAAPVAVAPSEVAGSPIPAALPQASDTSLDPAQAPAGGYTLDARHVSILWRVRHMGLSPFVGRFDSARGTLTFDPQTPANSALDITVAANSVSTSVVNRDGAHVFDQQIARDVFAGEANPDIRFVSRSIDVTNTNTGLVRGDLTLRGVTSPVVLEAHFEGGRLDPLRGGYVIAFTGRTMIDRAQWGARFSNPIIDRTVGDNVEILISAEFVKS